MENRGFFKNFKVTKYGKIFLAVSLIIVAVAAIVIGIFGFNLTYEYRGGNRVTVQVEADLSDKAVYKEYKDSIAGAIEAVKDEDGKEYGLSVTGVYLNKSEKNSATTISSIVFTTSLSEGNEKLPDIFLTDLNKVLDAEGYNDDGISVNVTAVGTEYNAPAAFADAFFNPLGFIILAAGLMCVYFAFRYSIKKALVTVYMFFADALILLALLAVTRLPFNVNFIVLTAVAMLQTVFSLVFLFDKIKTSRGAAGYNGLNETELTEVCFNENFKKNLYIGGISLVASLVLLIGQTDAMFFAAAAALSVIVGFLNGVFVAPAIMPLFKAKPRKKPLKAVPAKPAKEVKAVKPAAAPTAQERMAAEKAAKPAGPEEEARENVIIVSEEPVTETEEIAEEPAQEEIIAEEPAVDTVEQPAEETAETPAAEAEITEEPAVQAEETAPETAETVTEEPSEEVSENTKEE